MDGQVTIPTSYVLNIAINCCASCGSEESHSEFFAVSFLKSRHGTGTVRHLTRCDGPTFNIPVDRVLTGQHIIPFCAACPTIDLTHLPDAPDGSRLNNPVEERPLGGPQYGALHANHSRTQRLAKLRVNP
jgi:hypothetical protein